MTWRAPDALMERVRRQAAHEGRSMNEWVTAVMQAVTDPDLAGGDAERIRERLRMAGLVVETTRDRRRPPRKAVAAARKAAGRGTPLDEIVSQDRG